MRIVFPCLLALVFAGAPAVQAQKPAAADAPPVVVAQNQRRPVPTATPIPAEAPKKKGMLKRIFGGREEAKPTPRPAATPEKATPTPRPQRRSSTPSRRTKPEVEDEEKPAAAKVEKKEDAPAVAKKTTKPKPKAKGEDDEKKAGEEPAPEENLTAEQQAVKDAEAGGNPVTIEKAKYDEVKSRAIQDEKIVALKEKADAATNEDEGRSALRAYNKALFHKMRTMDSSIRERVDLMEDAVMKRLEPTTAAKK